MKVKLLLAFSILTSQFSFSQNEELLQGKILNQNRPIKDVDIINFNTKVQSTSDTFGNFFIAAKKNDLLVFISKDYEVKKLLINSKLFDNNSLIVILNLKAEELREVVITNTPTIKLSTDKKYEQSKLDQYTTEKFDNTESHQEMRNGTFVNGLNFVSIGKKLLDLISKEKEPAKEDEQEIEFAVLAKNTCDQKFFTNNLKLKPDEIDLFLQFCDIDPKSKALIKNHNILSMMDFLSAKNIEFQKLATVK